MEESIKQIQARCNHLEAFINGYCSYHGETTLSKKVLHELEMINQILEKHKIK